MANDSIKSPSPDDMEERRYLNAKFAIVFGNFDYFENGSQIERNAGFLIWKALAKVHHANEAQYLIKNAKTLLKSNDILVYADYIQVTLSLFWQTGAYNQLLEEFFRFENHMDLLPQGASFTRLGIYFFVILTLFAVERKKEAKKLLEKAFLSATIQPDHYYYSKLLKLSGSFAQADREYLTAKQLFSRALLICRSLGDKAGEISRMQDLGNLEYNLNHFLECYNYYYQSKELATVVNDQIGLAFACLLCARALLQLGKISECEKEYDIAEKIFQEANNYQGLLHVYNGLGVTTHSQGRIFQAIEYYEKVLVLTERLHLRKTEASTLNNLGILYNEQGDFKNSVSFLKRAQEIFQSIENTSEVIRTNSNIADVYRQQGNYQKALAIILVSLENIKMLPEKVGLSAALDKQYAEINFDLGQLTKAKKSVIEAFEKFQLINSPIDASITIQLLARINYIQNNLIKAINILEESINLLDENEVYGKAFQSAIIDLAEIHANSDQFERITYWLDFLHSRTKKSDIILSEEVVWHEKYIKMLSNFHKQKIDRREIIEFQEQVSKKEFFGLRIKGLLLEIRCNLQENDLNQAVRNITIGQKITSEKKIITLDIELALLKALVLSKQFDYVNAIEVCSRVSMIIKQFDLQSYRIKQQNTIELIENAQQSLNSLYSLAEEQRSEIEQTKDDLIPLETVYAYLDSTVRQIRSISPES